MPDGEFWRDRRVLVTGHTGFKGAWLSLWLQMLGAEVIGFAGPPPSAPSLYRLARVHDGVESVEGDVRNVDAVGHVIERTRPEIVFHLAAQSLVRRSLADPVGTYATNVMGTANLLEAVRVLGDVRAVVVVTSDKCYANDGRDHGYREDDPLGGRDPYSSSKASQELLTAAYRDSLLVELGVAVATARAGNVIGGGDWAQDRLVPDLMRAAFAGTPLVVRNPDAVRPWQHVLNPLSGYLRLAERLCGGEAGYDTAWNFGPADEDARPVSWVVERLRERWPDPLELRTAAASDDREAAALRVDSSRARQRLGWTPTWDLAAGIDATVEWYAGHRRRSDARAMTLEQIERFMLRR
ncbi:MAG: CDP-glucose 4,6-dehydratase [Actinomycetota bacterium]|nr:CDP-glucose 4,6-dehydratase [Actinomycetota bacterium]